MLKIKIITDGLSEAEKEKVFKAKQHLYKALNSPEFEEFVKNFHWTKTVCSGMWWWKDCMKVKQNFFVGYKGKPCGYTNGEVYNRIVSGWEDFDKRIDQEAAIFFKIDKRYSRKAVAYRYPNNKWQYMHSNWFKKKPVNEIAGTLCHEWLHANGHGHDFRYSYTRQFSVPYAIQHFVENYKKEVSA